MRWRVGDPSDLGAALVLFAGCFADPPPVTNDEDGTGSSTSAGSTIDGTGVETTTAGTMTTIDPDGGSTQTSDATTDGSTTETGDPCGAEAACAPAIPPDWMGPFVVATAPDRPVPCPAGWPESVLVAYRDPSAPPATCTCECGEPQSSCMASVSTSLQPGCDLGLSGGNVEGGACTELPTNGFVSIVPFDDGAVGTCTPVDVVSELLPPTFATTLSICAPPPDAPTCDEGVCVLPIDPPFAMRLCIVAPGEIACPPGPFRAAQVAFQGVDDNRDCIGCACGGVTGAICGEGSSYQTYDTADCSNRATQVALDGACIDAPDGTQAVLYLPANPGSCPTTAASMPIGEVVPTGAVTVCCTP